MYKLLLWELRILIGLAIVFGFLGILPYDPISILASSAFLVGVCYVTNKIFSKVFEAPANIESYNITALILCLIITPPKDISGYILLFWAAVLAMASKYILSIHKKHIFNPTAIALVFTSFVIGQSASWWVGTISMMPFVLICGLLLIKKLQRFDLVLSFLTIATVETIAFSLIHGINALSTEKLLYLDSPILFFSFIMLTEPLTTPPTRKLRMIYGAFVGIFFCPQLSIASLTFSPELSLVIGNIFSYLISPKHKLVMKLSKKTQIAPDIIDFEFQVPDKNFNFSPGQYMEWTLPHKGADFRGNRRYFTIASSPTEDTLRLGVKFYENGSSFKRTLKDLNTTEAIAGGQLAGDFTLPKDSTKKYVFIAGGIGITPFRSMFRYMLDKNIKLPVTFLFSNKLFQDIVYKDLLDEIESKLGIKTYYTLTDLDNIPKDWKGGKGRIDANVITKIPDFKNAYYYLSGPHMMVSGFEKTLHEVGIPRRQIKKDFFPGFV